MLAAVWSARPQDFEADRDATPERPAEMPWHLEWCGLGELRVHPAHLLDDETMMVVRLWRAHRGEAGAIPLPMGGSVVPVPLPRVPGPLPFAGGLAEQPAITMSAFAVLDRADAAVRQWGQS